MARRQRRGKHGQKVPVNRQSSGRVRVAKSGSERGTTDITEKVRTLERALYRYSGNGLAGPLASPDYSSFYAWASRWLFEDRPDRRVQPNFRIQSPSATDQALKHLAFAQVYNNSQRAIYHQNGGRAPADVSSRGDDDDPGRVRRFKLMLGFMEQCTPRFRDVIETIQADKIPRDALDKDLKECTQAQLRARFFAAVNAGRDRAALRIVGKLKEDLHDPGELSYFDAVCDFHANEWSQAIRYADEVKEAELDYPSAQALAMEALAQLGESGKLLDRLRAQVARSSDYRHISPFYVLYLQQLLIERSSDPVATFSQVVASTNDMPQWKPDWNDPAAALFIRQSCELATELTERSLDSLSRRAAIAQGTPTEPILESSNAEDVELWALRDQQLDCALVLHAAMYQEVTKLEAGAVSAYLVRLLMNPPRVPTPRDYKYALRITWRLGERAAFLNNVCRALDQWQFENDPELWDLLLLAYQQALSTNDERTSRLHEKLAGWQDYKTFIGNAHAGAAFDDLTRSLTPMGRLSYQTAVMSYEHAVELGEGWKDAGPISLTFFRTLELEISHRLLKSALAELGASRIQEAWDVLRASIDADMADKASSTKKERKVVEFWNRNIPGIAKLANGTGHGLDLGSIELVLRKIIDSTGIDITLKEMLRVAVEAHLTTEGIRSLNDGRLADCINADMRERYRNPPAHARYLPISVAGECRRHVENTLRQFKDWFVHEGV